MKTLLATLCLCLLLSSARAQTWPRNPKTGKVEFAGVLPWPATVKTEAQRRALARRWYLAKLTDSPPEQVEQDAHAAVSPQLLTYAGLPVVAQIKQGGLDGYALVYGVSLRSVKAGLSYIISGLEFGPRENADSTPLEQHLASPAANEQAALAQLRKRLAKAVDGWN